MQTKSYPPRPLTNLERGWVAGLYEGEGTAVLGTTKRRTTDGRVLSYTGARVSAAMTDRDVINRLHALWPAPSIGIRYRDGAWKTQYVWRIGKRWQVAAFLRSVLPLLGERRTEQALKVLAYAEDPARGYGSAARNKTHCPKGHPYGTDSVKTCIGRGPSRRCKVCAREYARRIRAEKKEARAS